MSSRRYVSVRGNPLLSTKTSLLDTHVLAPSNVCVFLYSIRLLLISFFRVHPKRWIARLIVAILTFTPSRASQCWQCSSRVASGYASSCVRSFANNNASFLGGRPGIGLGSRFPVSRRCLRYRLIEALDTPNTLITSARDLP